MRLMNVYSIILTPVRTGCSLWDVNMPTQLSSDIATFTSHIYQRLPITVHLLVIENTMLIYDVFTYTEHWQPGIVCGL
jgi:hypothetical protein